MLIIALLVLGGILSTLGDALGSRIGKARLSIFKLRPRRTAVLITIFTGSLISAISIGFVLLVSRQLRVGLFELEDLQNQLKESRQLLVPLKQQRELLEARIEKGEADLARQRNKLDLFRRGEVVISSGQSLFISTIKLDNTEDAKEVISEVLRRANSKAFSKVKPGEPPNQPLLFIRKDHVMRLEEIIKDKRSWVINVRSAANVLLGENSMYAYVEVVPNRQIINEGDILASITLDTNSASKDLVRKKIKLLVASTSAEVKKRGSLTFDITLDANSVNSLFQRLSTIQNRSIDIQSIATRNSYTAETVYVSLTLKLI